MKDEQGAQDRLTEIKQRWAKATPGPWQWRGNTSDGRAPVELVSRTKWIPRVMTFGRWKTQGAEPWFAVDGIIHPSREMLVRPESHNAWRVTGIDHPDAEAIAAAPGDIAWLVEELERAREDREACWYCHHVQEFAQKPTKAQSE